MELHGNNTDLLRKDKINAYISWGTEKCKFMITEYLKWEFFM
jgi:hypothetical protein